MEGKREGYYGQARRKGSRPHMNNYRKQFSHGTWVPAIPSWEKEFCFEIGSFTWKHFLEAKKNAIDYSSEKIMDWDDSAAEEAFHNAKNMFFAKKFNRPSVITSNMNNYSPDLYIDEIKWDDDREEDVHDREPKDARVESEDEDDDNLGIYLGDVNFWTKIFPYV